MKTKLIRIGNSKGIRIPKPILEQTGISDEVEMEVFDQLEKKGLKPKAYSKESARQIGENLAPVEMLADDRFAQTGIPEEEVDALVVDYHRIKDRKARHRLRDLARGFAGIKRGRAKAKSG